MNPPSERAKTRLVSALCWLTCACSGPGVREPIEAGDASADAHATDHAVDEFGYAVVGRDVYPPLYERVEAVACTNADQPPGKCATDADCGSGFVCLCGFLQGAGVLLGGQCVPAECRSAADCAGGRCLLSVGTPLGFYCTRSASTCHDGGDCPGNGIACIYDDGLDGFECKPLDCQCE